jgi:hypothetical protein
MLVSWLVVRSVCVCVCVCVCVGGSRVVVRDHDMVATQINPTMQVTDGRLRIHLAVTSLLLRACLWMTMTLTLTMTNDGMNGRDRSECVVQRMQGIAVQCECEASPLKTQSLAQQERAQ